MKVGAFADLVDAMFYDNDRLKAIVIALLLFHIALAISAIVSKPILPAIPATNLALALIVVLDTASGRAAYPARLQYVLDGADMMSPALFVFELIVAAAAVAALAGVGSAKVLSSIAFGLHGLVSLASVLFIVTFKLDRPI
jgi:hypothetical protein